VLTDFTAIADTFGSLTAELQKELVCIIHSTCTVNCKWLRICYCVKIVTGRRILHSMDLLFNLIFQFRVFVICDCNIVREMFLLCCILFEIMLWYCSLCRYYRYCK